MLWSSKKQSIVAMSSTEAEYIAASEATRELLWMKKLGAFLDLKDCPTLWLDNQGSIALAKDESKKRRTKHLDVKYNFIRDCVQDKRLSVRFCPTEEMIADILTKPVKRNILIYLRSKLMSTAPKTED